MKRIVYPILIILALTAMACSISSLIPSISPTSSSGSSDSNILYQDTLGDANSGWPTQQANDMTLEYTNGGYRLLITSTDMLGFVPSGFNFQNDVRVEVDATKTAGPDDNYIGLMCRYQDEDNFYFFVISSDGYAGIAMYQNNQMSILSGNDTFDPSSEINQGAATNHLEADCIGNTLSLYVNGTQVSSVTDTTFTSGGDAGILARANAESGVDILFSNFVVSKP